LDRWRDEHADGDELLLRRVVNWIESRQEDPYQGMRRERGFDNLWFGAIPGTRRAGSVVTGSYFIRERDHVVVCSSIATLGEPV
jgi:hypothetical protein